MSSGADYTEDDERWEFEAAMQAIKDKTQEDIRVLEERCSYELCCLIGRRETFRLGRRLYHEAPDDIMELIVSKLSTNGMGGMNVLRLASKRLILVVESCATSLTNRSIEDGPDSLPLAMLGICRRIKHIRCDSHNLRSLGGCPDRLKTLAIGNGQHINSLEPLRGCVEEIRINHRSGFNTLCPISDLSPLANCQRLKTIALYWSDVVDISVLSSMPRLEKFIVPKQLGQAEQPSIKVISPLSQCKELSVLAIAGSTAINDLSPLKNLSNLTSLDIEATRAKDLTPLAYLPLLHQLDCDEIPLTTSLLPLERCKALQKIMCDSNARDLAVLQERMPRVDFNIRQVPVAQVVAQENINQVEEEEEEGEEEEEEGDVQALDQEVQIKRVDSQTDQTTKCP